MIEEEDPLKKAKAEFWDALGCLVWVVVAAVIITLFTLWDEIMAALKAVLQ